MLTKILEKVLNLEFHDLILLMIMSSASFFIVCLGIWFLRQ